MSRNKYFPTNKRTYTRIVPIDTVQGAADLQALQQQGCKKLAVFDDTQAYGAGLAAVLKATASMYGIKVVDVQSDANVESDYTSVASKFKSDGAQCVELQRHDRQRRRHGVRDRRPLGAAEGQDPRP